MEAPGKTGEEGDASSPTPVDLCSSGYVRETLLGSSKRGPEHIANSRDALTFLVQLIHSPFGLLAADARFSTGPSCTTSRDARMIARGGGLGIPDPFVSL